MPKAQLLYRAEMCSNEGTYVPSNGGLFHPTQEMGQSIESPTGRSPANPHKGTTLDRLPLSASGWGQDDITHTHGSLYNKKKEGIWVSDHNEDTTLVPESSPLDFLLTKKNKQLNDISRQTYALSPKTIYLKWQQDKRLVIIQSNLKVFIFLIRTHIHKSKAERNTRSGQQSKWDASQGCRVGQHTAGQGC